MASRIDSLLENSGNPTSISRPGQYRPAHHARIRSTTIAAATHKPSTTAVAWNIEDDKEGSERC
eukprot:1865223-Rhodomonas_salina.1